MKKVFENIWLVVVIGFFIYLGASTGDWSALFQAFFETHLITVVILGIIFGAIYLANKRKK